MSDQTVDMLLAIQHRDLKPEPDLRTAIRELAEIVSELAECDVHALWRRNRYAVDKTPAMDKELEMASDREARAHAIVDRLS